MSETILAQARCTLENKDHRVTTLKRKERDMTDEPESKRCTNNLPARSRINADTDLWDQVTFLKQDCRTSGVIPSLEPNFKKGDTLAAYLCSATTDQLSTGFMDLGWGCGYRNCQMLMSFLEQEIQDGEPLIKKVLDISGIQFLIEKAWKEGFDSLGAAQLEHHVFKTRKWIGTTEVYTLFTYLGIRSTIIDFHQPGPEKLHKDMFDWIQYYFTTNTTATTTTTTTSSSVYITNKPPLYLQHQGHSRTVIGIELLKSGKRNLIMFDPGRRMLRLSSRIKYNSSLSRPFRVDDKTIAKNKQYSLLVLGQVNYQNGKMIWDSDKT
ncbi:hypothetical protein MFLAVUS_005505 [Mucor flavus]|uniref:UFSP1/2/DUB catalytic domain-containing protein n=1 Tax=Mucor flavus TaxID=439312 RepID=A0ABP9YYW8_9FUNG